MSIGAVVSLWPAGFDTERGVPKWKPMPGVCKSPAWVLWKTVFVPPGVEAKSLEC